MSYSILDKLTLAKNFSNLAQSEITLDLVAMGNVYVDYHSFIQEFSTVKYEPQLGPLKADLFERLRNENSIIRRSVGGGAVNVAVTLSKFGLKSYFLGKSGNDDDGHLAHSYLSTYDVIPAINTMNSNSITDRCLIFILPDGERRILGTSDERNALVYEDFKNLPKAKVTYIELSILHFLETRPSFFEFIQKREKESIVACSLVSENTAHRFSGEIRAMLEAGQIDILFGNEAEMMALENVNGIEHLKERLSTRKGMYLVTEGRKGAQLIYNNYACKIPPEPCQNVVDTTGAGDQFAAGFLYGLCKGWDLEKTGKLAASLSSHVIRYIGQDFDPHVSLNNFVAFSPKPDLAI